MAGKTQSFDDPDQARNHDPYRWCLIRPMGRNGDPTIQVEHVIDAALVGILAFAAVILGDALPALVSGSPVYLRPADILARMPTAAVASLLAFAFQWARARGLDILEYLPVGSDSGGE